MKYFKKGKHKKQGAFRIIAATLAIAFMLIWLTPAATAFAEDEDDSYDIAAVSNSMANIFTMGSYIVADSDKYETKGITILQGLNLGSDNSILPKDHLLTGSGDRTIAGNAGVVVAHVTCMTSMKLWRTAWTSLISQRMSYTSLLHIKQTSGDDTPTYTNAAYEYALYGSLLRRLGLDVTRGSVNFFSKIARWIGGSIAFIAWALAKICSFFFDIAIALLKLLNPFGWLDIYITKDLTKEFGATYAVTDAVGTATGFKKIFMFLASIYVTMCNLSWAFTIPMMLAIYLANMLLFKKISGGKRLIKRILFISIGIPLIGSIYTSFLNNMGDIVTGGDFGYADKIIAETFVDFENWAKKSNLAIPEEVSDRQWLTAYSDIIITNNKVGYSNSTITVFDGYDVNRSFAEAPSAEPVDIAKYRLKDITLYINQIASGGLITPTGDLLRGGYAFGISNTKFNNLSRRYDADDPIDYENTSIDSTSVDIGDVLEDSMDSRWRASGTIRALDSATEKELLQKRYWTYIADLLIRYMSWSQLHADDYAASIQAQMTALSDSDPTVAEKINTMMKGTSYPFNFPTYKDSKSLLGKMVGWLFEDSRHVEWDIGDGKAGEDICSPNNKYFTIGATNYSILNDGNLVCESSYESNGRFKCGIYRFSMGKFNTGSPAYSGILNLSNGSSSGVTTNPDTPDVADDDINRSNKVVAHGLSTLSMFNYLNTEFENKAIEVYGTGTLLSNTSVRPYHMSVNIPGESWFVQFSSWLNSIVLLVCIAIIGILYSIGMFTGTIKYTFSTIKAMPLALLGSLAYMAKFTSMVVAMMANILITAFMYGVVCEVLIAFSGLLTSAFVVSSIAMLAGGPIVIVVTKILSVIIIIRVTMIILKVRKEAVQGMTSWMSTIVQKFFEAEGAPVDGNKGPTLKQAIGGGLAGGASMALGHSLGNNARKGTKSMFDTIKGAIADDDGGGSGGNTGSGGGGNSPDDNKSASADGDPPDKDKGGDTDGNPPDDKGGGSASASADGKSSNKAKGGEAKGGNAGEKSSDGKGDNADKKSADVDKGDNALASSDGNKAAVGGANQAAGAVKEGKDTLHDVDALNKALKSKDKKAIKKQAKRVGADAIGTATTFFTKNPEAGNRVAGALKKADDARDNKKRGSTNGGSTGGGSASANKSSNGGSTNTNASSNNNTKDASATSDSNTTRANTSTNDGSTGANASTNTSSNGGSTGANASTNTSSNGGSANTNTSSDSSPARPLKLRNVLLNDRINGVIDKVQDKFAVPDEPANKTLSQNENVSKARKLTENNPDDQ